MARVVKIIFVLLLAAGIGFGWLYHEYSVFVDSPIDLGDRERIVQIPSGSSAGAIAHLLKKNGIVQNEWMMRYVFIRSGLSGRLQPGAVVLTPGMTPQDLPDVIARVGKYARKTVQILAGMNVFDIGERLQTQRIADSKTFVSMALDPVRAAQAGIPAGSFEGYLASGAYTFEAGDTPDKVLEKMHERWLEQWHAAVKAHRGAYEAALGRQMTDHSLITLASIVEKEAVVDAERPVIARIFMNRMRKKMKLQSDPTCIYPPKSKGEKPSPERCRDENNPYSTYVIAQLPPGPISTPSQASMVAVLSPYNGPDAGSLLYFVARQDGSWRHYFSKTYAEHQVAVDYFLKGKKNKAPKGTVQP
jgi:UPF0755 protein